MACKIVVRRFNNGMGWRGDCVNAYPFGEYLGKSVEEVGGEFVIVEVTDADFNHPSIQDLLTPNLPPTTHNNIYGLRPVNDGEEFFTELLTHGRVAVTLAKLLEYKVVH